MIGLYGACLWGRTQYTVPGGVGDGRISRRMRKGDELTAENAEDAETTQRGGNLTAESTERGRREDGGTAAHGPEASPTGPCSMAMARGCRAGGVVRRECGIEVPRLILSCGRVER